MADTTQYYLGRVIKLGQLSSKMIAEAIQEPKPVMWHGNAWSFFDAQRHETRGVEYICARLSKFNPEGEVIIADIQTRQEIVQKEPNLRIASSYFIYIPEVSGIAFTRVHSHIKEIQFIQRFCDIIKMTHDNFFVECEIRLITDLKTFAEKLMSFDSIYRISANLNPPNPLFGPLWKNLKSYIETRRSDKMLIREETTGREPLNTDLPMHVKYVANQTLESPYKPKTQLPFGDEAILMAADGYGTGLVKGLKGTNKIVIKTSETVWNFDFDREPDHEKLFETTYDIFKKIEKERHMEH